MLTLHALPCRGNARNGFTELMRAAYEGNAQRVAELVLRDAAKNKHVRLVKRTLSQLSKLLD